MSEPAHLVRILERLQDVARSGRGWAAHCPIHPDRHESLGVTVNDAGRVNLHCFAGCQADEVLVALGLSVADLYPDATRKGVKARREHRYHDAQGTVVYAVRRLDGGRNRFVIFHPTDEGWAKGRGPSAPRLYRLPHLLAEPDLPVFICEGERDADKLAGSCGLATTTVASGSWSGVDLTPLAGRVVYVVVDNDRRGWQRGLEALAVAQRAGALIEAVWRPPDRFKDATELIANGGSCDDFVRVDLTVDEPPCEVWHTDLPEPERSRSADAANGLAIGIRLPVGVFLHFVQAGQLHVEALAVWALLEDRAGTSGIAHLTAAEISRLLGVSRRCVGAALDELEECALIKRERRARVRVFNPAQAARRGTVPHSLSYKNRSRYNPFLPPRPPNTSPASAPVARSGPPATARWTSGERAPSAQCASGEDSAYDALARLGEAFPGAELQRREEAQ